MNKRGDISILLLCLLVLLLFVFSWFTFITQNGDISRQISSSGIEARASYEQRAAEFLLQNLLEQSYKSVSSKDTNLESSISTQLAVNVESTESTNQIYNEARGEILDNNYEVKMNPSSAQYELIIPKEGDLSIVFRSSSDSVEIEPLESDVANSDYSEEIVYRFKLKLSIPSSSP